MYFTAWPSTFHVWAIGVNPGGTYTTSDGQKGYPHFLVSERIPPTSTISSAGCTTSGAVRFALTDNAGGSGPKAIHYSLDGGAAHVIPTSGNPGVAQTGSVKITATDDLGLSSDPSKSHKRLKTGKAGHFKLTVTAIDVCGHKTTETFHYRVKKRKNGKKTGHIGLIGAALTTRRAPGPLLLIRLSSGRPRS